MADQRTDVRVSLADRSYDIGITSGGLALVTEYVTGCCPCSHAVVIADANVMPRYAEPLAARLRNGVPRVDLLCVPAGESSKSVAQLNLLWEGVLATRADRRSVIVAVGGGVVGDLAGFVAASFARGLPFVQVPTTLLAQVDSSVGGKVGINLPSAKNMVGAFWQPKFVLIDTEVLKSLPVREYRAGLAEVVKYGVIMDAEFFAFLEQSVSEIQQREASVLRSIVARCCRLKADVVEKDERETSGLRAILNYGHTFAHALEAIYQYGELLHGEAVSIGMMAAARLAHTLGRVGDDLLIRQARLLELLELPIQWPEVDPLAILGHMRHDKKVEHGRLRFVLPARIGHVELVDDVDERAVMQVIRPDSH